MRRTARERWIFCAVSFALLLCAATYRPAIDGNSPGEISRFLRWEMADRGIGPIQLLAVEDEGADRFAVFQGEKRPDERYLVRFRQNEDGEYEADGHPMWMYGPYPVRGVYSQALDGDGEVCFAVWNESETLAEVRLQVNDAPEADVPIPAPPSLTIWRLQVAGTTEWRLEDRYFDTAGNMLP